MIRSRGLSFGSVFLVGLLLLLLLLRPLGIARTMQGLLDVLTNRMRDHLKQKKRNVKPLPAMPAS